MGYAPVIAFDQAKPLAMARQLLALGVSRDRILATRSIEELSDLWTRERTIASLQKLTGHGRHGLDLCGTDELVELERRAIRNLMGADGRTPGQLIYSISGRQPRHPTTRRRQHLAAWDIPA